eukprot:2565979-Amphidinium_carterae.1
MEEQLALVQVVDALWVPCNCHFHLSHDLQEWGSRKSARTHRNSGVTTVFSLSRSFLAASS